MMTRTSATGSRAQTQGGFSLPEVLIVVFLVALAARAVVLTLPDAERDLRKDVETFAARLAAAQDLAVLNNRTVATVVDARGYRFEENRRGEWLPATADMLPAGQWSGGIQLLAGKTGSVRLTMDGVGLATPTQITFYHGSARLFLTVTAAGQVRIHA